MSATLTKPRKMTETRKVANSWLRLKSENSKEHYERVVRQFFGMMFGKVLDDVTATDIMDITRDKVISDYIGVLKDAGMKDGTILNYLAAVRSFIKSVRDSRIFYEDHIDYSYCISVALSGEELKKDAKPRTNMATSDVERFSEWLEGEFSERYKDKCAKYQLALKFMSITAVRVDSTFNNIKWSNIKNEKDGYGNRAWVVYALDKGAKVNRKPISEEFYQELRDVLFNGDEDALVFGDISKQGFTRLMGKFSKETGDKFTPHSIKVGAGTTLYRMTKDIYQVSKFLDHNSIEMTKRYIRVDDDMSQAGSFILSSNVSIDNIDNLDYDTLVDIVKSRRDLAYVVINEAKKRGDIHEEE